MRVEVEAVRELHTVQEGPELGTDEGTPSVGRVYVEPETLYINSRGETELSERESPYLVPADGAQ